jgi:hypothetical protein
LVSLSGNGYPANVGYRAQICIAGSTSPADCDASLFMPTVFTDATGSFTQPFVVHSGLRTDGGTLVDCRVAPGTCEVRVGPIALTNRTGIAPLDFDPASPLTPQPAITVAPDDMLVDRQHVTVSGVGFVPQFSVQIQQCGADGGMQCQTIAFGVADDAGAFVADVALDARLWFGVDPGIDCRVAACQVRASMFTAPDDATAAIMFDPDAPLAPAPVLTADPAEDLVDHQIIDVQGSDYDLGIGFASIGSPNPVPVGFENAAMPSDLPAVIGDQAVDAVMCFGSATDPDHCAFSTLQQLPVDAEGNVSGVFQVEAVLHTSEGTVDCRDTTVRCELRAGLIGHPFKQAAITLAFDPEGVLAPPPTVTATPTTDLVDGQPVRVTGIGLSINRTIMVIQCSTDRPFPDGCSGPLNGTTVAIDGTIAFDTPVSRSLDRGLGETTDCAAAPGRCALFVIDQDFDPIVSIALTFRGSVQTPTPPGEDLPPATDPPDDETTGTAVVLPATETRPSFTG